MGREKKLLLGKLPEKFSTILPPNQVDKVTKVWKDFQEVYGVVTNYSPSDEEKNSLFKRASSWLETFLSLGAEFEGYQRRHVTPYMHLLVYHVSWMVGKI